MPEFGSLITAMITPFKGVDSADYIEGCSPIDFEATEKLVEHLVKTGSDALVVTGTTGENPTLTHEEEQELFRVVRAKIDSLGAKTKVLFGTGSNSTQTVLQSNKIAEKLGADGVLIVTPYYNKPNQKGLKAHFNRIAQSTDMPIILYNIPGRCVINLEAQTIVDLVQANDNIVGLKEASNNFDQVSEIRQSLDSDRFKIYSGDDSLTLPMLGVGADGVISVASHLVGKEMKDMMDSFFAGDVTRAKSLHNKLFPIFIALFNEPNPTCVKAALKMMGICSDELREPLVKLEADQVSSLKKVLDNVLLNPVS